MGDVITGIPGAEVRICGHGYQAWHCPMLGCAHHGLQVGGQDLKIAQATTPLIPGALPQSPRPCEHCYCTDVPPSLTVPGKPHKQCCNCGNKQLAPSG